MSLVFLKLENNETGMTHLQMSLKKFGLRPDDWVLKPKTSNVYRIENADTPEFYFEGVTKKHFGRQVWRRIYLKSI